ncbi:ABC-F family ATP-binding cassette domain-containing protein [Terricaulis sp.]|uniref:ABC-F family ATP-binding cassette domain-containing protein n=1 Tax=Terricaulis sp. TaxID=2768686 RepID=UPI003782F97B
MSASIVFSNLAWAAPGGRVFFSNLDLAFASERTGLVGRNGVGKTTLLRLIAGDLAPTSGSVSVEGRIAVLRQTVQVDPNETVADLFGVREALALLARAEAGRASTSDIANADWTLEARLAAALARLGLEAAPDTRLAALSGGQRTRAALAALVFAAPDFLLLDEPTNNLDRQGRQAVADLLQTWRAGAIVVSHDRDLLDAMDAIVELTSLGATRYGGGWTAYRERKALELAAARHDLADAEKRLSELAQRSQEAVERKARKDAVGKRKAREGGMPRILLGGMKMNAENTTGEQSRLAERRREAASADLQSARERIEVLTPITVSLPPTGLAAGKHVLRIEDVTAGYAPGAPVLSHLSFAITGPERVAIAGVNGAGKTTLLSVITGALEPWRGVVRRFTPFALLDQRVSVLDASLSIRDNFLRLNPRSDENTCRAALARFMFRAGAALQIAGTLSGGQLLRAGLACVLGVSPPPLLILDEPTNHLDIDSLEAVEAGLRAYDGALLIVSHDETFLGAVGVERRLRLDAPGARTSA